VNSTIRKHPSYHQFITQKMSPEVWASQEDWDALVAFAKASGFEIIGGTRDSRDLWLRGSVADMEKAFHVTLGVYQDPRKKAALSLRRIVSPPWTSRSRFGT